MTIQSLEEAKDRQCYLTLREIIELPYHGKNSETQENQALLLLRKRPKERIDELCQFLQDEGFRRIRPYGWGHNAFVAYTTKGQLIRITPTGYDPPYGEEGRRPDCPRVLGSFQHHELRSSSSDGWRVEYVNELPESTIPCTEEDLINVKIALAKYGLIVWDPKPENLRRLNDGTPIFVDADTVRPPDTGDDKELGAVTYYASLPLPPFHWGERSKESRHTWKQCLQFPQLNPNSPVYKKLLGVVSKDELEWIKSRDHPSQKLVSAIEKDGLYPEQLPNDLKQIYDVGHAEYEQTIQTTKPNRRR